MIAVRLAALALSMSVLWMPGTVWSQTRQAPGSPPGPAGKAGLDYVILQSSIINYSSIGPTDGTAETHTVGVALGTYISDYFKVEIRAGGGFTEDTLSYLPTPRRNQNPDEVRKASLDVSLPYYASWYLGLLYPWSEFSHVYGQFGFSHVKGKARTETPDEFEGVPDKLYGSSFSVSWLLGLDFELTPNAYLLLEGGRLHTDTDTTINTMQYSLGLRYEF